MSTKKGKRGDKEIDDDDGLTLPDAEQLFGKRKDAETDYEEFEVGELGDGEEYEEFEEVEEFEDGDEFELDFDTPAPSQPAMAAQVHTPAPRMFIPPPQPGGPCRCRSAVSGRSAAASRRVTAAIRNRGSVTAVTSGSTADCRSPAASRANADAPDCAATRTGHLRGAATSGVRRDARGIRAGAVARARRGSSTAGRRGRGGLLETGAGCRSGPAGRRGRRGVRNTGAGGRSAFA